MLTDEHEHAMKVWREACGESQEAFYRIGEQPNDPESIKQGQLADQAAAAVIAADRAGLVARIEELEGTLRKANEPQWFYLGDDCSSDQCRFCIDECISEDFEWDNHRNGDHVLHISGARPVPDMWVALHYFTDAEKDERQDDEPYAYTVHATEDEARATLGASHDADA